jgi:hypothetical protein
MTTFSDEINRMIIDLVTDTEFSSASPGHINHVLTVGQTTNPDLEAAIIAIVEEIVKFRLEEIGIPVGETEFPREETDNTLEDENPPESEEEIQNIIDDFVEENKPEDSTSPLTEESFSQLLNESLGGTTSKETLLKFAKNPRAVALGLVRSLPFIGGIVGIQEFSQAILSEIERVDTFFKVFIPDITNLHNQLRDREEIANIQAGNQQLILNVRAGATSPRTAYNTFNQFNKNRARLENEFTIRDNSGVS